MTRLKLFYCTECGEVTPSWEDLSGEHHKGCPDEGIYELEEDSSSSSALLPKEVNLEDLTVLVDLVQDEGRILPFDPGGELEEAMDLPVYLEDRDQICRPNHCPKCIICDGLTVPGRIRLDEDYSLHVHFKCIFCDEWYTPFGVNIE